MHARAWLAAIAAGGTIGIGLSAHAAYRAISEHPARAPVASSAAAGYERQDHFPGAALFYAAQDAAAPATGATGTTDLPALPISAALIAGDDGVVAARPFSMAGSSTTDRNRALLCLTTALYYEAASEPDAGQRAVAQVILNRARHPAFPATVCGVVYQGVHTDTASAGCQFSFACDVATMRIPARAAWARAARNAGMALAGYVYAPVGLATHYHTYAVTPAWNRTLVMTDVVGAHFFHRWKGYWGTAAAFSQRYHGGEPVPGGTAGGVLETPPVLPVSVVQSARTDASPALIAPVVLSDAQPAYQKSGEVREEKNAADSLPPRSEILDRWKDSGKPL